MHSSYGAGLGLFALFSYTEGYADVVAYSWAPDLKSELACMAQLSIHKLSLHAYAGYEERAPKR